LTVAGIFPVSFFRAADSSCNRPGTQC
jgi:hypothetical protein